MVEQTETKHLEQPDYTRPVWQMPDEGRERIYERLLFIYGQEAADRYIGEIERVLKVYCAHKSPALTERERHYDPSERFTQQDVILITYGDLLKGHESSPLATLAKFCDTYLEGTINTLHILPFFPYSSDRGFSVVDFEQVDPSLGTWEDIHKLEGKYNLMFDGVINHVSSQSRWFQEFLNGNDYYNDFFIHFDSPQDLSPEHRELIFRPRTSDVLTRFDTLVGEKWVWSTFSEDQLDLNYKHPEVLKRVLDLLLLYVRNGADIIRLDAVTYLWAEAGTRCVHLEQTHQIVKLLRDVLDMVAPGVALITETNVPHEENISYFGDGGDEAQMVYNFALPPLTLHAFYRGDATTLSKWAATLETGSGTTTFFNFLDSHDGIGVMGARGILPTEEIDFIVERAAGHGALISHKAGPGLTEEPYEINTTWFSALNGDNGDNGHEDEAFQVRRFVASRAVALVLQGVPGIYMHSLVGTPNDMRAVVVSQVKRDINRTMIDCEAFEQMLRDPLSKASRMGREFGRMISLRTKRRAFHPNGPQKVLELCPEVFAVLRFSPEGDDFILSLINVTGSTAMLEIELNELRYAGMNIGTERFFDIVNAMEWLAVGGKLYLRLEPYEVKWLERFRE